jgi:hypothetical protein
VTEKTQRRLFTAEYKRRILAEADAAALLLRLDIFHGQRPARRERRRRLPQLPDANPRSRARVEIRASHCVRRPRRRALGRALGSLSVPSHSRTKNRMTALT